MSAMLGKCSQVCNSWKSVVCQESDFGDLGVLYEVYINLIDHAAVAVPKAVYGAERRPQAIQSAL
jgi:hypothetical protein